MGTTMRMTLRMISGTTLGISLTIIRVVTSSSGYREGCVYPYMVCIGVGMGRMLGEIFTEGIGLKIARFGCGTSGPKDINFMMTRSVSWQDEIKKEIIGVTTILYYCKILKII